MIRDRFHDRLADEALPAGGPPIPPALTIVAVDDEPIILSVYEAILEAALDARVLTTDDGLRALELIEHSDPQLVITDLIRPGLGYLDFICRVRALRPELPVLVASAHASGLTGQAAREAGASACLVKPFTCEELLRVVGDLLGPSTRRR
jgi:two-component system nitrogen regulation response regulator GlnG